MWTRRLSFSRSNVLAFCGLLCIALFIINRVWVWREVKWDFRESNQLEALRNTHFDGTANYMIFPGASRVVLLFPGDLEVVGEAREIVVWHRGTYVFSITMKGQYATTDDAYERGVAFMNKYGAPESVIDELKEWRRSVSEGERMQSFLKFWDHKDLRLGVEIGDSFRPVTRWYPGLIVELVKR